MQAASIAHQTLPALLAGMIDPARVPDLRVGSVAMDSRQVEQHGVFLALAGVRGHALDYLDDALARGAAAVLVDAAERRSDAEVQQRIEESGAVLLPVPDLQRQAGPIVCRAFGHPSHAFRSITAVTGTDGKTSVSHFIARMLDERQAPAAVAGTLGCGAVDEPRANGFTTPDPVLLQQMLAELVEHGFAHVALEASSHGLAQYRLDGTRIDVAVLTQLGRDHLDFHGDMAAYAAAKARLFAWPGLHTAVLNLDDPFGCQLVRSLAPDVRCIGYSTSDTPVEGALLRASSIRPQADGLRFTLVYGSEQVEIHLPLLGSFNVANALGAAGALLALDYPFAEVAERLLRIHPVPGRMELFAAAGRPGVIVDYAHTPGALAAAIAALRAHTSGRIWCIFGAGGERDRGKRPLMAQAAARADSIIVTDDNPRSEDPAAIVADIQAGFPAGVDVHVEHDRGRALAFAVAQASMEDRILLAGKGHEINQIYDGRSIAWSDRTAAARVLGLAAGADA